MGGGGAGKEKMISFMALSIKKTGESSAIQILILGEIFSYCLRINFFQFY